MSTAGYEKDWMRGDRNGGEKTWQGAVDESLSRGIPGTQYLPRSGFEAFWFRQKWCVKCQHEFLFFERIKKKGMDGKDYDGCPILLNPLDGDISIWWFGEDGMPVCRLFVPVDGNE
ncbi:hypothetical protein OR1_04152 [Geobacter sp. OR-1]|uniref:hypothetical protein n=1 Tax=Geobacter sp. OR-1 TaxID=1266765 RepID=UPI000543E8D8|nr:hypothetical protein [Geobacter sp. OR-1]GAM11834.1 hypothetical protein OR1_04152 [Geobacter sp. OR-1]